LSPISDHPKIAIGHFTGRPGDRSAP
jgi:hypothetical protein